ncbi:MAG: type II secretion system protein [Acidobacteria bacterium]|nr:type II secretion system protein [Acidobacteriota bacterium]
MSKLRTKNEGVKLPVKREWREAGFTLLEVLVATVILGTAVAALFGLLSGALRNADRLQAPEQALLLGQAKMNDLLAVATESGGAAGELPLDQKIEGRWDDRFRWEAQATRFRSSPERAPGGTILARIALDVFWKLGAGEERKLSLETYQLRLEPVRGGQ